jgi:hypothetical protein
MGSTGFALCGATGLEGAVTDGFIAAGAAGFAAADPGVWAAAETSGIAATAVSIAKRFQRTFVTVTYPSQTPLAASANIVPSLETPSLHRMNRQEQGVDARFTAQFRNANQSLNSWEA